MNNRNFIKSLATWQCFCIRLPGVNALPGRRHERNVLPQTICYPVKVRDMLINYWLFQWFYSFIHSEEVQYKHCWSVSITSACRVNCPWINVPRPTLPGVRNEDRKFFHLLPWRHLERHVCVACPCLTFVGCRDFVLHFALLCWHLSSKQCGWSIIVIFTWKMCCVNPKHLGAGHQIRNEFLSPGYSGGTLSWREIHALFLVCLERATQEKLEKVLSL